MDKRQLILGFLILSISTLYAQVPIFTNNYQDNYHQLNPASFDNAFWLTRTERRFKLDVTYKDFASNESDIEKPTVIGVNGLYFPTDNNLRLGFGYESFSNGAFRTNNYALSAARLLFDNSTRGGGNIAATLGVGAAYEQSNIDLTNVFIRDMDDPLVSATNSVDYSTLSFKVGTQIFFEKQFFHTILDLAAHQGVDLAGEVDAARTDLHGKLQVNFNLAPAAYSQDLYLNMGFAGSLVSLNDFYHDAFMRLIFFDSLDPYTNNFNVNQRLKKMFLVGLRLKNVSRVSGEFQYWFRSSEKTNVGLGAEYEFLRLSSESVSQRFDQINPALELKLYWILNKG